ncbi:MAG: CRISPR-associated endonuclease Cas2 [Deltaproteobacteria bacterium RIFOXYA12_FULL_61_11]|nr:MAG: CRISPR-associated endonuclease Cas2 [Deltaproteobacteria bacterium RIFOXYA12_FULL_61_11]
MAWLVVMFDLPVGTKEERRIATRFRKDLERDGFNRIQYSVYARACPSLAKVETHLRRLRPPQEGEVRALVLTDLQWSAMRVFFGGRAKEPERRPEQLQFFF